MLWELIELQRNPPELVKVKGASRRLRKPQILAPEKFQELVAALREPYKTMAIVAMCTGLRVSEILALRWEHIDFNAGVMLVQQGVVTQMHIPRRFEDVTDARARVEHVPHSIGVVSR